MNVAAMLRRAGALTLLVYAVHTLAACALAAPLGTAFFDGLGQQMYRAQLGADDAALVLELGARRLPELLPWSVVCALVYAALAPLLRVAWLHAMTHSSSARACLAHGLRRYPAALLLGIGALLVWALSIAALVAAWSALMALLPASIALEQVLRIGFVLLAALVSLLVSTLHDLAVTGLAGDALNNFTSPRRRPAASRALHAARRALSLRTLALHALLVLAIAACLASAEALARSSALATAPSAMLAAQQTLVFTATLLRATWLAIALERVALTQPRCEFPAPHAAGSTAPTR